MMLPACVYFFIFIAFFLSFLLLQSYSLFSRLSVSSNTLRYYIISTTMGFDGIGAHRAGEL